MRRFFRHRKILFYPIWKPKRSKLNYPINTEFDIYMKSIWFNYSFPKLFYNYHERFKFNLF